MKHSSKAIAVSVVALLSGGILAGAAEAATVTKPVRSTDFIAALADTRSAGHTDFLREGLHVWTDDASSNAKAAEYFAMGPAMPTAAHEDWYGTTPQPGMQIVFDFDQTTGNGNDFNILVGEPVYGVDGQGNYTDWWLTNGSSAAAKALAPNTSGGSGSGWHGTLAQWAAALPTEKVYAGGFSLGSGVKGDGVLRSLTYDDTVYEFTDTPATTPAPVAVAKDVTGAVARKGNSSAKLRLVFKADATPAGFTEGKVLKWKVKFDGKTTVQLTQGAGDVDKYSVRAHDDAKHIVTVFKNGVQVAKYKLMR